MNVFEAVKQSVTTRQAAEHYGIKVNRNGMAVCPFHNDRTPSMKTDRRFYCFGCGATGDVIDFASRLHGLNAREAAILLANDFSVPYEDKPQGGRKHQKPPPRQKSPEQQFEEIQRYCFRILADYRQLLADWKKKYAPHSLEETWHPLFEEALQNLPHVEYLLDILLYGEIGERAALICDYGKEVKALERRMAELAVTGAASCEERYGRDADTPDSGGSEKQSREYGERRRPQQHPALCDCPAARPAAVRGSCL